MRGFNDFVANRTRMAPARPVDPRVAAVLMAMAQAGRSAPPGINYGGGGGGVTANDILGQRGAVVTGPPLAPPPGYGQTNGPIGPAMPPRTAPPVVGNPSNPLGFESMPAYGVGQDRLTVPGMLPGNPTTGFRQPSADPRMVNRLVGNAQLRKEGWDSAQTGAANTLAQDEQAMVDLKARILTPGTEENKNYQDLIANGLTEEDALNKTLNFYSNPQQSLGLTVPAIALDLVDKPRQGVVEEMGANAVDVATGKEKEWGAGIAALAPGNWNIPGIDGARLTYNFKAWAEDPENWDEIKTVSKYGFQADENAPRYTGGRAVWELYVNGKGKAYRSATDVLLDPTILLGAAKESGVALDKTALELAEGGAGHRAAALDLVAKTLKAPQTLMDATVDAPFNLLGEAAAKGLGKGRARLGGLFAPTGEQVVKDARELNSEALNRFNQGLDRMGETGPPPITPSPDGGPGVGPAPIEPDRPPDVPLYTMEKPTATDAVIVDPQGKEVKRVKVNGKVYEDNQVMKEVETLNRPLIEADMRSKGMQLPEYDLDYLSPAYRSYDLKNPLRDDPDWTATREVAQWSQAYPDEGKLFWRHYEEPSRIYRTERNELEGINPGPNAGVREKTLLEVNHFANDVLPAWRESLGKVGATEPRYRFRHGEELNEKDIRSVIEHAMFGQNDTVTMVPNAKGQQVPKITPGSATRARSLLPRMGMVGETSGADVARQISKRRAELFGEESLSQNATSIAKRTMRANEAAQPAITPSDVVGDNITTNPTIAQRTAAINQPAAVLEPKKPGVRPRAKLLLNADERAIRQSIEDPATLTRTPRGYRVDQMQGRDRYRVYSSAHKDTNVPYIEVYRAGDNGPWRVSQFGNKAARGESQNLGEAIDMADSFLNDQVAPPPVSTNGVAQAALEPTYAPQGTPPARFGMQSVPVQKFERFKDIQTPQGPVARGTHSINGEKSTYTKANLSDIKTDTGSFQNRKADWSEQSVKNITDNYDERKFTPVEVKQNDDGTYTVLSGHSRVEAWRRMVAKGQVDPSELKIQIQHGTDEELRILAQTSNTRGTGNTPTEKGRLLKNLIDGGVPPDNAFREVNVKPGEAKRLIALTNLSEGLQDQVDQGLLSVTQGAELGEAIAKKTLTPLEADALYFNTISTIGMSDVDLRDFLATAARMKSSAQVSQGGLFGGMDLGDSGFVAAADKMIDLNRKVRSLRSQDSALKSAAKSSYVDESGKASLQRATTTLRKDIATLEAELGLAPKSGPTMGIVPASSARHLQQSADLARGIRAKHNALTGRGVSDAVAMQDKGTAGLLRRMGEIDDETYTLLRKPVMWSGRPMPLYEVYETLAASGMSHHEAVDTINRVLHPFPAQNKSSINKFWDKWRTVTTIQREQAQYNVKNGAAKLIGDQVGNAYSAAVTGHADASVATLRSAVKIMWGNATGNLEQTVKSLPTAEQLDRIGVSIPENVFHLNLGRTETGTGDMAARAWMKKKGLNGRLSGAVYGIFANKAIKDLRNGGDLNSRFSIFATTVFRKLPMERTRFYSIVRERAARLGKNELEQDMWVQAIRDLGDKFSPADVRQTLGDERLARDWQAAMTGLRKEGSDEVNRVLFSYKQLNIDEKARLAVFYHYWLGRALVLHSRTALQNPYLLNAYINAWDGLKNEAEKQGYPRSLIGTLQFMGSATGFRSFIDPIAVVVPFDILQNMGDTSGGPVEFMRSHGAFFNPIIEAAFAVAGATDRVPDLTQTRAVRRGVANFIGWLNSNGYEDVVPDIMGEANTRPVDWIDDATTRIIDRMNEWASALPLADREEFSNPQGYELDQVKSILITNLEAEFGPMSSWPESVQADYLEAENAILMNMDGNDYADDALEEYYDAQAQREILTTGVPGGVVTRYGPRDFDIALAKKGWDKVDNGEEPTIDEQNAMDRRDAAKSPSGEVSQITMEKHEYDSIGTTRQQEISDGWTLIAFGDLDGPEHASEYIDLPGGTRIWASEIAAMEPEDRKDLATKWVDGLSSGEVAVVTKNGSTTTPDAWNGTDELKAYRDERDAFVAAHPTYKKYEDWKDQISDSPLGKEAWIAVTRKGNPSFDAYLTSQEAKGFDAEDKAFTLNAYYAYNGEKNDVYDLNKPTIRDESNVPFNANEMVGGAPAASGGSSGGSGGSTVESRARSLAMDEAGYQLELKAMEAYLPAIAQWDQLAPMQQDAYRGALEKKGVKIPSEPEKVRLYRVWKETRSVGADTSYTAYITWLDEQAAALMEAAA